MLFCRQSGLCCFYTVHSLRKFANRSKQLVDCWKGKDVATVVVVPSLAEEVLSLFGFAIFSSVGPGWGSTPPISKNTKQCRHCNTCCVRVHTNTSSHEPLLLFVKIFLQNETECPYERPVAGLIVAPCVSAAVPIRCVVPSPMSKTACI